MIWRTFFRENRWQKLFSIGLALLIWFTVRSTEGLGLTQPAVGQRRTFEDVPITVLTSAADLGRYRVEPETVQVQLRGDREVLEHLTLSEVEAYVNLIDLRTTPQTISLHVNSPPGTALVAVNPIKVLVERLTEGTAP